MCVCVCVCGGGGGGFMFFFVGFLSVLFGSILVQPHINLFIVTDDMPYSSDLGMTEGKSKT